MADWILATFAILAFGFSIYSFHRQAKAADSAERRATKATEVAERRARMPVLMARRNNDGQRTVTVTNVGRGPAINIVIAQAGSEREPVSLKEGINESWWYPTHLEPIGPWQSVVLALDAGMEGFGLSYTDAFGNEYTVKMRYAGSKVFDGLHLPRFPMEKLPFPGVARKRIQRGDRWDEHGPWPD